MPKDISNDFSANDFNLDHDSIVEAYRKGKLWAVKPNSNKSKYNEDIKWFKGSSNRGIRRFITDETAA
tara:strand:- start:169 stop:372 length:204 start_codon:yes stop_codon:yes gene_type:complete